MWKKIIIYNVPMTLVGLVIVIGTDFLIKRMHDYISKSKKKETPIYENLVKDFSLGMTPNTTNKVLVGGKEIYYYVNSLGMRDSAVTRIQKDPGCPRILFVGDSFTQGFNLPFEKCFVGIIKNKLKKNNIDVQNAGAISYCPSLYSLWVQKMIGDFGLKVDSVVVLPDVSDVFDEYFYQINQDKSITYLSFGPFQEEAKSLAKWNYYLGLIEIKVESNFVLIGALLRNLRLCLLRSPLVPWYVREKNETDKWENNWPEYRGPYEKYIQKSLIKQSEAMLEMANYLRKHNISLTIVTYPNSTLIRNGNKNSAAAIFWQDWCSKNDVMYLNMFPLFFSKDSTEEVLKLYYTKGDVHWNEAGNALMAEALLDPEKGLKLPFFNKKTLNQNK